MMGRRKGPILFKKTKNLKKKKAARLKKGSPDAHPKKKPQ
jgi:hypothetical protein